MALIELRQGFQLSKQVSLNILDRIDLPNKKFLIDTPSTSLGNYNIFINHLGTYDMNIAMIFCQISDSQNCITILPFDSQEKQKEFILGYTQVVLDILSEEACMKIMKIREMKDDIKNIICSETNPIQKVKENVSTV